MKIGIYVDAENVRLNGGYSMRYDVLREFARRTGGDVLRMNTYMAYDEERAREDQHYRNKQSDYQQALRNNGWKVITKKVKRYTDEEGNVSVKANADLDLAVDILRQGEHLDYILLVTGDGDFSRVVSALQDYGCRVEILAFKNISNQLRQQADSYHNGYLIPNLLPMTDARSGNNQWGKTNHKVRGIASKWIDDKAFGFLLYLVPNGGDLLNTNYNDEASPYRSAFVHLNELTEGTYANMMSNRDNIFEFTLSEKTQDGEKKGYAADVTIVAGPGAPTIEYNGNGTAKQKTVSYK